MLIQKETIKNSTIRQKISAFYRINEAQAVERVLPAAEVSMRARSRAWERARSLVLRIRQEQDGHGGIDALLNEFSLSSEEGVVLMCLAEALLRVPDKRTQDELIRDKLSQGQWSSHLGNSDSLFVNASAWGLMFTGSMVNYANERKQEQFGLLKKTLGRMGEPVIRKAMNIAMKIMGKQFVMGETIEDAVKRAQDKEKIGYVYSYDMLGEGARTFADADRYYKAYMDAIEVIGKAAAGKGPRKSPGISVKLSAIHPRYDFLKYDTVVPEISKRLKNLCLRAKYHNIGLTVDAEESERLEISLDIIENVFADADLADWQGFGIAVQAYQKRALFVVEWLREVTQKVNKKMMVRLVKGAYWDTEIKHTQQGGHDDFPVFTRKASTDVSYHACANRLLAYRDTIYPQFATHNAYTASVILELAGDDKEGFEFQCLHGMGDTLYDQIVTEQGIQCRVYAPVGHHEDLLAYLVRRLLENGANSSFVNAIVDDKKAVEELLTDPVEHTQRLAKRANTQIVMPVDLYGQSRANAKGIDVYDVDEIHDLSKEITQWFAKHTAQLASLQQISDDAYIVRNPANLDEVIGFHHFDNTKQMLEKLSTVQNAFGTWSQTDVKYRSDILMRIADILERHMHELIGLCIKEAGKITQDSIDEVREAVDFARYYAVEAQKLDPNKRLAPRGVILCISPWNFPLAIFLGQVLAALATGNTVIAKPAEQTSLIALRALELMHAVGLPKDVLQLVIALGPDVGSTLLPDQRIQGVMFTGSTQTGTLISRSLAQRGTSQIPLIAETGGQNCMIVDSTALPEQVVDDVVMSGFRSAGQRCSALRVLFLQDEIADTIITMIKGAMQELSVGDPQWLSTDLGPVIDAKALRVLREHENYMQTHGTLLYSCELNNQGQGHFFSPKLYEINDLSVLQKEVFGPCVHVVRFKGNQIDKVMAQINETGFGLTMGIHTRIEQRAYELAQLSRAGNVYVNRNMIGAIVGVQPFGGRGLSGTGPKAGGPNYLPRLMMEKITPNSHNTQDDFADDQALISDQKSVKEVAQLMQRASAQAQQWRLTSLTMRVSAVRQLLAKIATVDIVEELADDLNSSLASARAQLIEIEKKLKKPQVLPGPTGESNTLHLEPRGVLVTFADKEVTFEYWLLSIVTALATGNIVIAVVSDLFYDEAMELKAKFESSDTRPDILQVAKLKHLEALLEHDEIAGMVVDSNTSRTVRFVQKMAAREGAILPVITAEYNDTMINRLMTEKTISVDTTASGGNTSLMTLTDEDE